MWLNYKTLYTNNNIMYAEKQSNTLWKIIVELVLKTTAAVIGCVECDTSTYYTMKFFRVKNISKVQNTIKCRC